jgi:hypothetical protein
MTRAAAQFLHAATLPFLVVSASFAAGAKIHATGVARGHLALLGHAVALIVVMTIAAAAGWILRQLWRWAAQK